MGVDRPDWQDGEAVEAPAAPAPLEREEGGKVVRSDWREFPPSDAEPDATDSLAVDGKAIIAELESKHMAPAADGELVPYDELSESAQAAVGNEVGYYQLQENISYLQSDVMSPAQFAAMSEGAEALPNDARSVLVRLAGLWGQVPNDELVANYEALSDWLPFESSVALRTYLGRHGFIRTRGR